MARKKHGGGHGGAWKVAYADFVTAMMAFFLVLWILGLSPDDKKKIEEYFKTPIKSAADILFFTGLAPREIPAPLVINWPKVTGPTFVEKTPPPRNKKNIKELKDDLRKIEGADSNMQVTDDETEVRVDLIDNQKTGLFSEENHQFTKLLTGMLGDVASLIKEMPNRIAIEGHTNALPYQNPKGETNWELSTERANQARLILEKNGVSSKQIMEIKGCADNLLLKKGDPMALINRRISIVIKRKIPFYGEINDNFAKPDDKSADPNKTSTDEISENASDPVTVPAVKDPFSLKDPFSATKKSD